jgi:hypothetical protein
MSLFQSDLDALARVHAELLAAVEQTDIARIEPLVARRGDLLASLAMSYASASNSEREAWRPAIDALAREDRELTGRFVRERDRLAAELARASAHAGANPPESPSGGLNLHA